MCIHCGCSDLNHPTVTVFQHGNVVHTPQFHCHSHSHPHTHPAPGNENRSTTTISLESDILAKNNLLAQRNRGWFEGRNILALNLVSSPGSGKTTILETTIPALSDIVPVHVIEGDQASSQDAERIQATGCKVAQINTGTGCHLDAHMLAHGLDELQPPTDSIVLIENVGNLVCPALFDLGEFCKVAILSVTEGDDKPLKYPHMFRAAQVLLLNKVDLLPYVSFDIQRCLDYTCQVNPDLTVFQISAMRGDGMQTWHNWIIDHLSSFHRSTAKSETT